MRNRKNRVRLLDRVSRQSETLAKVLANLESAGRTRKQFVSQTVDAVVAVFALWLAYSLRLGQPYSDFGATWYQFVSVPGLVLGTYAAFGIYKWVIRTADGKLTAQLMKASALAAILLMLAQFIAPPEEGANPRSLAPIFGVFMFLGAYLAREAWGGFFSTGSQGEPVAIYGAGGGGRQLARMLSAGDQVNPVVFIDDNPALQGSRIQGLDVIPGDADALEAELRRYDVRRIILAMPSLSGPLYQKILVRLEAIGVAVQTMPTIGEILGGERTLDQIRDISITDILGRTESIPDRALMAKRVRGRSILVTGGGGSIGSELCRQILTLSPSRLVVVEQSEENLYHITEELLAIAAAQHVAFVPLLGTVTSKRSMRDVIERHKIDVAFHAAAYKHVPIVESQPECGVRVNVFGTKNVLDAAIEHGCSDFVLISTDKAVRPTNAMGASKRVAEMCLLAAHERGSNTRISMVRFGNVLGSSGSVVPKFKEQIRNGGPVTVTHPDVTRYFMSIPEAAQLVLQAAGIAQGGEVFVLEMGQPIRIADLARNLIQITRARNGGVLPEIDIEYTGLRPGEKLYEELFIGEHVESAGVDRINKAHEKTMSLVQFESELDQLQEQMRNRSISSAALRARLLQMANCIEEEKGKISQEAKTITPLEVH